FFFSSRRRHTRSLRDWSSDVCSSDLYSQGPQAPKRSHRADDCERLGACGPCEYESILHIAELREIREQASVYHRGDSFLGIHCRSEERRVGKECRHWWAAGENREEEG